MSEPLYRIWSIAFSRYLDYSHCIFVDLYGNCQMFSADEELKQDNYIIQRCTGEQDVNGKYIYEGDIIKYGSMFCGYDKAVIEFGEGQFKLQNLKQSQFENILSIYITVIGNNLENPELLLEKDEE